MANRMDRRGRYLNFLITLCKYGILICSTVNIFEKNKDSLVLLIISIVLTPSFYFYEFTREKTKLPLWLIIAAASTLLFFERTGSLFLIYYFFLLDDIFDIDYNLRNKYIIWHGIGYMWVRTWEEREFCTEDFVHIFISLIFYFLVVLVFYIIHHFKYERDKFKMLYDNLAEYSFQEREFAKELNRTEISQELHDSLGHLFAGGLLTVRYAKAVDMKHDQLLFRELAELEEILQQGMENLRACVKNIREIEEKINLTEEILHISNRFDKLGMVKVKFTAFSDIEDTEAKIKNCCYSVVREAITNSIIHGKASSVIIEIQKNQDIITMMIKDDGIGVDNIVCSYGLDGMKKKISEVEGTVEFSSATYKGFFIKVVIPETGDGVDD